MRARLAAALMASLTVPILWSASQGQGTGARQPLPAATRMPAPAPLPAYRALQPLGATVYSANCAACHGAYGDGRGPLARNQAVAPRSFADAAWMAEHADGGFFVSVQRGVPGSSMPPFAGRLSEREMWAAVVYLRTFAPGAASAPTAAPRDLPSTTSQEVLGKTIYAQQCAGCHGVDGRGNGPSAAFFTRRPRDLTNRAWMSSRTDMQLTAIVRRGVAGSPMPAFGDTLTGTQLATLVTYLRQLSGSAEQPAAVSDLYRQACAACHGLQGDGQGPNAPQLSPRPRDFTDWRWQGGIPDAELTRVLQQGRPGTAMPPFRALLSDAEIGAMVAQVRAFGQVRVPRPTAPQGGTP